MKKSIFGLDKDTAVAEQTADSQQQDVAHELLQIRKKLEEQDQKAKHEIDIAKKQAEKNALQAQCLKIKNESFKAGAVSLATSVFLPLSAIMASAAIITKIITTPDSNEPGFHI